MSQFAKMMLVATSLAPALIAFAIVAWQKGKLGFAAGFLVAALLLIFICFLIKSFVEKRGSHRPLQITAVESTDKEALAFIIAYLFPVLMDKVPDLTDPSYQVLAIYTYGIIGLVIYHSNAFHFNPVLALFGYHFYQVTADEGMKYLLITRHILKKQSADLNVTKLSAYVYLEIKQPETSSSQEQADAN